MNMESVHPHYFTQCLISWAHSKKWVNNSTSPYPVTPLSFPSALKKLITVAGSLAVMVAVGRICQHYSLHGTHSTGHFMSLVAPYGVIEN